MMINWKDITISPNNSQKLFTTTLKFTHILVVKYNNHFTSVST